MPHPKMLLLISFLAMVGCSAKPVSKPAFAIKDVPAGVPEFKREYTVTISRGIKLKVTIHYFIGDVMRDGELDQSDGKWVLFEPENPADKILDREILPEVQRYCKQIIAADNSFRANKPNHFVDEHGDTWVKTLD